MRIYVLGLGKLGLPVALALEEAGHALAGWDVDARRRTAIYERRVPETSYEPNVQWLLDQTKIELVDVVHLAEFQPDLILVCVQTPHTDRLDGTRPITSEQAEDFDYSYLCQAVSEIHESLREEPACNPLVVIVSTCLPGTFEREIRGLVGDLRFAYHPLFIAMSSVIRDFNDPEFILIGSDDRLMPPELLELYRWHRAPKRVMSITSAELTKVYYNTWLGYKLMLANTAAELADQIGADVDDVLGTLQLATQRLVSSSYMDAGMGDGGPCHGRDGTALSWLAQSVGLSHDPFGVMMRAREQHAEWLADILLGAAAQVNLPPIMLGGAYKPGTPLRTGSHALLVAHYLAKHGNYPVRVEDDPLEVYPVAAYFLATPHRHFLTAPLPAGSVLVDPWGLFEGREGVTVIRPGRRESSVPLDVFNVLH